MRNMADRSAVDEYIGGQPAEIQAVLERVRAVIRAAAPGVEETVTYQMPTFTLGGKHLVYVAAWKHHLSIYPVPPADEAWEQEIAPYRAAKSTLRFPYAKPIPYELIGRVVARLKEIRTA